MVDYPTFSLLLSTWTKDTFLALSVTVECNSGFIFYHLEGCSRWLLVEWNDRSELRAAEGRPHPVHQLLASQSPVFVHVISLDQ